MEDSDISQQIHADHGEIWQHINLPESQTSDFHIYGRDDWLKVQYEMKTSIHAPRAGDGEHFVCDTVSNGASYLGPERLTRIHKRVG